MWPLKDIRVFKKVNEILNTYLNSYHKMCIGTLIGLKTPKVIPGT